MRYRITHHYLTIGDDGQPMTETVSVVAEDYVVLTELVVRELDYPGGRSGTTITLTVTALDEVTI